MLKTIPLLIKLCSNLLLNVRGGLLAAWARQTQENTKIFKELERNCKNQRNFMDKLRQHCI